MRNSRKVHSGSHVCIHNSLHLQVNQKHAYDGKQLANQLPNLLCVLNKFTANPLYNPNHPADPITASKNKIRRSRKLEDLFLIFILPCSLFNLDQSRSYLSPGGRGSRGTLTSGARPGHRTDGLMGRVPVLEDLRGRHGDSSSILFTGSQLKLHSD